MAPSTTNIPANIRGVLFDMDGTLLDSETLGCRAVYETLKDQLSPQANADFQQRGLLMPWDLKQQSLGLPGPQWAPLVLDHAQTHWVKKGDPPIDMSVDDFLTTWDGHMQAQMHTIQAMKGANELVQALAQRHMPMAIATSSHAASLHQKRQHHESMFQHMSALVAGDDPAVEHGKPAPDIYLHAAQQINVPPHDCLVVEDGMPGVRAGNAAGCFVVAVPDPRFTQHERDELFAPVADLVVDDLTQLHDLLLMTMMRRSGTGTE